MRIRIDLEVTELAVAWPGLLLCRAFIACSISARTLVRLVAMTTN